MYCCDEDCLIGDLVCLKTYNQEDGWFSIGLDVGVVIEVIPVDVDYMMFDKKLRCYDYVIYWAETGIVETIPDLLIERYEEHIRRLDEEG